MWAPRGSRSTAVKQTRYEWVYLYAAVEPATGASVALLAPHVNTGTMKEAQRRVEMGEPQRRFRGVVPANDCWERFVGMWGCSGLPTWAAYRSNRDGGVMAETPARLARSEAELTPRTPTEKPSICPSILSTAPCRRLRRKATVCEMALERTTLKRP